MKKLVKVGNVSLGDGQVYVQSMLKKPADDIEGNINQAKRLFEFGCEIIRVAVPSVDDARLVSALKNALPTFPLVADIHFDYKIALAAISAGADKIRINPGNIGGIDGVKAVAHACKARGIPIRVGVNSGSLEKELLVKYKGVTAEGLAESAKKQIALLNRFEFDDIVLSVKASDVKLNIAANRLLFKETHYPLHIGVTESGLERAGLIKSAAGIGGLLCDGIGDTIRVSLTATPELEVQAAYDILAALRIKKPNRPRVNLISCPTCGRTKIDLLSLTEKAKAALAGINKDITVAVMGCAVNGPGEAKEADYGIAGGDGEGIIFIKGEIVKKVKESELLEKLLYIINCHQEEM
ncbi:MAG: flavodoxin-dependent (E)-4-hydroxy-3-methylbut-2-enyl-diphosphate synthase [Oscillospiraceae bacterium]|nr:flavodoxin-dependent (E)-4-hydroxy-3-methylbut-2-enyl-diphosphate synthase [Oscillospiraceae bacterium]